MRTITYQGKKYYFYSSTDLSLVLNQKKETMSLEECKALKFKSVEDFAIFLNKLKDSLEDKKERFLDEQELTELISDNLTTLEGLPIGTNLAKTLLPGLNYKIVKVKDTTKILDLLMQICSKNRCLFIQLPLEIKVKEIPLTVKKYLKSPLGSFSKTGLKTCPILIPLVLKALNQL